MSRVVLKWVGSKPFGKIDKDVRRHMGNNLKTAGIWFRDEVKRMLSTPVFPRSSPGEPPRREFGNLINSYLMELDRTILTARIGSGMIPTKGRMAPYARYLEYGTVGGKFGPIEARPHLRPAAMNNNLVLGTLMTRPMP